MKNKILTVIYAVALFFFIITFAIGLPIYCRFFYYLHINALDIPSATGRTYEQIKVAYDQLLNYLTLPNRTFSAGVFEVSPNAVYHFAECKNLFTLNFVVLLVSFTIFSSLLTLSKLKVIKLSQPFGMDASLITAISVFALAILLGVAVSIDFDKAFTIFHKIFFPTNEYWYFEPTEEIIYIFPPEFFLNCAILIGSAIFLPSTAIIVCQVVKKRKIKKKNQKIIDKN